MAFNAFASLFIRRQMAGVKLSTLVSDKEKTTSGVWCEFCEGLDFKIARMNNPEFRKYVSNLSRGSNRNSLRRIQRGDTEATLELTLKAMAKHILVGWRGLEDDEGNEIPYSSQKAEEILKDSQEVYEFVELNAMDAELFKKEDDENAAKNLGNGSGGP
jgi:hypothetical protein